MFIYRAISNIDEKGGGVFVFKNDHHVLIEYLIEWTPSSETSNACRLIGTMLIVIIMIIKSEHYS